MPLKPDNDGLGLDRDRRIPARAPSFAGARFTPVVIPTVGKSKTGETESSVRTLYFPIKINAVGVAMGPQWCESCKKKVGDKQTLCPHCQGAYLVKYRQKMLAKAAELRLGVAKLVPEPENKYDSTAVAVHIRWKDGETYYHVGYIPAKRGDQDALPLIASEIFPLLVAEQESGVQRFWVECQVIGGQPPDTHYGLRLTIKDTPA
jgi:DNA-directed RNA polymerase subunit RPC12/RpoP